MTWKARFVAHAMRGEYDIKDGGGRSEGEQSTAAAVIVLANKRKRLEKRIKFARSQLHDLKIPPLAALVIILTFHCNYCRCAEKLRIEHQM